MAQKKISKIYSACITLMYAYLAKNTETKSSQAKTSVVNVIYNFTLIKESTGLVAVTCVKEFVKNIKHMIAWYCLLRKRYGILTSIMCVPYNSKHYNIDGT